MSKSVEYWRDRFELLQQSQLAHSEEIVQGMDVIYKKAIRSIDRDIRIWYHRFAQNNMMTYSQAKKLLRGSDLEEFHWAVDEYIKFGKLNALDQKFMQQLENASARVHISRLEALKLQLEYHARTIYNEHLGNLDTLARGLYEEGYYKSMFEIQRGYNLAWNVSLNRNLLESVLKKPWTADGNTFSKNIWVKQDKFISLLHTELSHALIRGDNPGKLVDKIAHRMKASRYDAGRLIFTESAYFSSAGQKQCYKELDLESFEIVATLDGDTSELCRDLDGAVVELSKYEAGVTAPPFHPWCRSVTCPWFPDDFDIGKRAARNEYGKTYYVSDDTQYHEWRNQYTPGGPLFN